MKNLKLSVFIFLTVAFASQIAFTEGKLEEDKNLIQGSPEFNEALRTQGIVIIPENYLRGFDPITIFYNSDVGPAKGGPLDNPGDLLAIVPPPAGEYRFLDARTLQFLPAANWPALKTFTVRARSVTRTLTTLMIPPTSITPPAGSRDLEPIKTITLFFTNEIPVPDLAAMLSFEIKPLPGVGKMESIWLTEKDFTIKMADKVDQGISNQYQLTFTSPIPYGKLVFMHIRLSVNEKISGSLAAYTFATKQEFRLYGMGSSGVTFPVAANGSVYSLDQAIDCGGGKTPLILQFTEDLSSLSVEEVKKMIHFEPAVREFGYEVAGNNLYLHFGVDTESPYKLRVTYQNIASASGRTLAFFGDTSFYFYYRQQSAYLQWKQGQAIVERFGPKLFPMQGRGLAQADLRIYRIDPENRNFWPFPAEPLAVDEESRPPMPGEEPAYGTDLSEQIRLLGTPLVSQIVTLPISENSAESVFGLNLEPLLARISGDNAPGTYLVGYRLLGTSSRRIYVRLSVTDLSLSVIEEEHAVTFAVTSLDTGQPLSGARVVVEGERIKDGSWVTVISGTTDGAGLFRYSHESKIEEPVRRIIVTYGADKLVFDPYSPPPVFTNNHWFSSDNRWLSWVNSDPRKDRELPRRRGYVFTERPVYRPEEPVYIMGYVRVRKEGLIQADDASRKRNVIITGPGYKQWTYPIALNDNGSFYVKFDEKDLPTGDYSAVIQDVADANNIGNVSFKKEAYRVPRFEVNISGPDRVPLDREFELILTANYYAGGRVVGQDVIWEITKYPYTIRPAQFSGFIFSTDEAFSGGRVSYTESATSRRDVTNENGSTSLKINPALENEGMPRVYVVEATVRGADTQTVTAVKQVLAVPSFAIGLKLERFLKDDKVIRPEIIIIDHNEKPLAGKQLSVRLFHREWHSYLSETDFTTGEVKYHTDVVDKQIFEKSYESTEAPLALSLPVDAAGVYVVEVLAKDSLGRLQKLQSDLYVAGETPESWQKAYANIFETALDKKSYVPGEQASLLLKSPFQEALALVIIEAPARNEYRWVEVHNGQGLFSFPIMDNMMPSVPVHALLLRGRLKGTGETFTGRLDRGKPIAMANTTWVSVDSTRNILAVTLDHQKINLPGKKMQLKILVKDSYGNPVSGTASLWLVDRAVLSLGKERTLRPLSAFIDTVYSFLRISETRNEVVGNIPVEEIPGGEEMSKESESSTRGASVNKADELFKKTTVRRNFQTVPYINPSIPVQNGFAEITIDLPENLTDFAVRAVVASGFDKFGTGSSVVSIRLPVIIQAALPRFVRPGDEFTAGGIGRIVEGSGGEGSVAVQVEGIKLKGKENVSSDSIAVQWQEKIAHQFYFPFIVPKSLTSSDDKTVTIRMAAERLSDHATDGFELKLPIKLDNNLVRREAFLKADPNQPLAFPKPDLPARPGTMRQTIVVTYEPGIIKLLSAMRFLASYVHGCTEQRVSKLYPSIALKQSLAQLGLADLYTVPDPVFQELITFLGSVLTPQGLYSYWPGSTGYVSLTAYVVEFLTLAKNAGYQFPDKLLTVPMQSLKESLRSDYDYFISGYSFRERVEALVSLALANAYDSQYAYDLLVGAFNQDLYTQAKILDLFLVNKRTDLKQVKDLSDLVWSKTVFKLKDANEVFAGLQSTNEYYGGLVLSSEIRTLATVIRALYRQDPLNNRVSLMIDYLMSRGDESGWGSTSDNAASLMAATSILDASPVAGRRHAFEIVSGNSRYTLDTAGKNVAVYSWRGDEPATVRLASGDAQNAPSVWMYIEYVPDVTGDQLPAENKGFVVERELLEYGPDKSLIARRPVMAGQAQEYANETIVEEHVSVINPEDRNFVAVAIPFAAGFELMNPELEISSKDAIPAGTMTLRPTYALYGDDAVIFYYDTLPKGTFDFYFRVRASFTGNFSDPPARAEMMYDLKTYGRSSGTRIIIKPKG